ncbi:hypothetical protein BAUCODRAFT_29578 [Baudoinia panamericana UAMH 10762]|uniref:Uncharacterized protein n=1 Tax=Baudoinia panamericana (strain UAMH 10762) TaxID=717646 RepID=M2MW17_BAUPA|nr:uncharacterized protein BAUCODRAFT_29578 [Baudoinia panamericana UAMH 10762]EMD01167.1 hypothetical protein BAUCODRAFT_29578 [Baudoinia panamericana UAMH 10762]
MEDMDGTMIDVMDGGMGVGGMTVAMDTEAEAEAVMEGMGRVVRVVVGGTSNTDRYTAQTEKGSCCKSKCVRARELCEMVRLRCCTSTG